MKKSEKNLLVLQNFILHITHSSDVKDETPITFTPAELYMMADSYIEEDHVDGKKNPDDDEEDRVLNSNKTDKELEEERRLVIRTASLMLSTDGSDEDAIRMIKLIASSAEVNGDDLIDYIDGVDVWQKVELEWCASDFLEYIGYKWNLFL